MRRLAASVGTLAFAAVLGGCGADAKEEAPGVGTGEVVVQAPPNAVGAGVDRPVPATPIKTPSKTGTMPVPTGHAGKPPIQEEPNNPVPPPDPGGTPQKGTDL